MLARDVTRLTTDVTEDVRERGHRDSCDCRKAYISRCPKLAISIHELAICADVCVCGSGAFATRLVQLARGQLTSGLELRTFSR